MQALGCRDQVLHCSPWHDLLKWTWHPVTGQLKAALSSKSFDKAYDSREGFFFTRSAQFSGGACFNLEQKDWWVPFREMALLNCLSLCRSAIPQQWVSGNCSQSSYEPDNQSNSWQCCAGALWDGHCSVMNCLNFIPVMFFQDSWGGGSFLLGIAPWKLLEAPAILGDSYKLQWLLHPEKVFPSALRSEDGFSSSALVLRFAAVSSAVPQQLPGPAPAWAAVCANLELMSPQDGERPWPCLIERFGLHSFFLLPKNVRLTNIS